MFQLAACINVNVLFVFCIHRFWPNLRSGNSIEKIVLKGSHVGSVNGEVISLSEGWNKCESSLWRWIICHLIWLECLPWKLFPAVVRNFMALQHDNVFIFPLIEFPIYSLKGLIKLTSQQWFIDESHWLTDGSIKVDWLHLKFS